MNFCPVSTPIKNHIKKKITSLQKCTNPMAQVSTMQQSNSLTRDIKKQLHKTHSDKEEYMIFLG